MTVFAYLRVSTDNKGQTTDNQKKQIIDSGFRVDEFVSEDGVSGSMKAFERPAFSEMYSRMQESDTLIIVAVDRLGRSASDILNVIEQFKDRGIKVVVLQFGNLDITSPTGKMIMTCMGAMAELERNMLIERTKAGMARTKSQGTKLGRPLAIHPAILAEMMEKKQQGVTYDVLAEYYEVPRITVIRNISKWTGKWDEYEQEWNVRQNQYSQKAVAA